MKNYKETQKKYYQKNKHIIKQKRQRQQERDETEQKFYKYGFWLLLTAVLVDTFINQILK